MNILVLAGLFLVGLVAIVVVVLLVMGERESENGAAAQGMAAAKTATSPSAPSTVKRLTVPLYAPESAPENTKAALSSGQSWSMSKGHLPLAREGESYSALPGGQLHELTAELHSLHIRTAELQQRLGVLVEMVDRLEHDQGPGLDFDDTTISP